MRSSGVGIVVVMVAACGATSSRDNEWDPAQPPATLELAPAAHDFGEVIDEQAVDFTFSVFNTSGATSAPFTVDAGGTDASWSIASTTCTTLDVFASCAVVVTFRPAADGPRIGHVSIVTSSTDVVSRDAMLGGIGVTGVAELESDPTAAIFPNTTVDSESPAQTITMTNRGSLAGMITATLGGPDPTEFVIDSDACTGATLVPLASCGYMVSYAPSLPTATGKNATITFVSSSGGSLMVPILGSSASTLQILPEVAEFGTVVVDQIGPTQQFTVTNLGSMETGPLLVALTRTDPTQWQIVATTCHPSLVPNESCTVSVAFAPTATGPKVAQLDVTGAFTETRSILLTGTATASPRAR